MLTKKRSIHNIKFRCNVLKFALRIAPENIRIVVPAWNVKERVENTFNRCNECIKAVERLMDIDQAEAERIRATKTLGEWKYRAIISVIDQLMSEEPNSIIRYWLAIALGDIGGNAAIKVLIRAMGDEDPFARLGATDALEEALKKLGRRARKRALKKVINCVYLDNRLRRISAVNVLCNIGKEDPQIESLLAQLRSDPDKRVQSTLNIYWKEHLYNESRIYSSNKMEVK